MRPFLPFVTLLSTVFLLGCQEQGSGLLGPEGSLFDGKGKGTCEFPDEGHCHGDDVEDPGYFD